MTMGTVPIEAITKRMPTSFSDGETTVIIKTTQAIPTSENRTASTILAVLDRWYSLFIMISAL
ncbi:MAG: hypothetical protein WC906_05005 [Parcubacteria group bacterium]